MHYSIRKTYFSYPKTNLTNIDGFFSSSSGGSKGVKSISLRVNNLCHSYTRILTDLSPVPTAALEL